MKPSRDLAKGVQPIQREWGFPIRSVLPSLKAAGYLTSFLDASALAPLPRSHFTNR
jgi:hypothetical protein